MNQFRYHKTTVTHPEGDKNATASKETDTDPNVGRSFDGDRIDLDVEAEKNYSFISSHSTISYDSHFDPATPSMTQNPTPSDVDGITSETSEDDLIQNEDTELRVSLSSLGLERKNVEFIIEQGEKYFENSRILSMKLKIPEDIASKALEMLEISKQDPPLKLTRDIKKIQACLKKIS